METISFLGLACLKLHNQSLELLITRDLGPRIIRLSFLGGENLLAELPELTLDCPGSGSLKLWGGHRLWHAPEMRRRTYMPDDRPPTVKVIENGLAIGQPTESKTGIQKTMRVWLPDDEATVIIDHTLKNEGLWPVELAPWAITQLKTGGTAILPQSTDAADADGLLPNRRLAIWPYTDLNSPHIQWGNSFIFVDANMSGGALKLGFPNPNGWLAYHRAGILFVKQALYQPETEYFDFGSSSECYCNPNFIELETLGPRTTLSPREAVTHRETWRLFTDIGFQPTPAATQALMKRLGF